MTSNKTSHIGSPGPVPKTILLIEDDELFLQQARIVLSRAGHRVLSATNVSDAEEIWARARSRIDVVFSDHFLGFDRGADLVQRFKTHEPAVKMILCSGSPPDAEIPGIKILRKPMNASAIVQAAE